MKTINRNVETILQASEDGEHTYSVTKLTDGEMKKHLILVMLYPTRTEENMLADDDTMYHILSHLKDLDFDTVTVLNLFSKDVNGCRLSVRGLEVDRENLDYIQERYIKNEAFKESTWAIAWGSANSTSKAINESKMELLTNWTAQFPKEKMYQLTAKGIDTKAGQTIHPLYLGIRSKFSKWKLEIFPHKKYMEFLKKQETEKQEKRIEREMKKTAQLKNKDN